VVTETADAVDPVDAHRDAADHGMVVHRADPLNCETSIPALIGGIVMPQRPLLRPQSLSGAGHRPRRLAALG
jgi:hypothetical protein